ncbi:MAG: DNA-protecting protein DprA, partial [Chitinophagaceae bacterium]|nr:DNA-protecting protein DprA [Chitinophagaceae bacterium]
GCLKLIIKNKAALITCANDLIEAMGWMEKRAAPPPQRLLFPELSPLEKNILDTLTRHQPLHIDELYHFCQSPNSALAGALLNLELNNLVHALPGKQYRLL